MSHATIPTRLLIKYPVHRHTTSNIWKFDLFDVFAPFTSSGDHPWVMPLSLLNSSSNSQFIDMLQVIYENLTFLTYLPHLPHLGTIHESCHYPYSTPHQIPSSKTCYKLYMKIWPFWRICPIYLIWGPSMSHATIPTQLLIKFPVHRHATSYIWKFDLTDELTPFTSPGDHPWVIPLSLLNSSSNSQFIDMLQAIYENFTFLPYWPHLTNLGTIHESCHYLYSTPHQIPNS